MYPFSSYTSVKIVHEQQVQEALERNRIHAEQAAHAQGLFQAIGQFIARFTNQPDRKQTAGSCNDYPHMQEVECKSEPAELTAMC
jgi:hypothetical protein